MVIEIRQGGFMEEKTFESLKVGSFFIIVSSNLMPRLVFRKDDEGHASLIRIPEEDEDKLEYPVNDVVFDKATKVILLDI